MKIQALAQQFRAVIEESGLTDSEARCAWDWTINGRAPVMVLVHPVLNKNLNPEKYHKVRAIKAVRDATHCSLLEAKVRVEQGLQFMCPSTEAHEMQQLMSAEGHYRCYITGSLAGVCTS